MSYTVSANSNETLVTTSVDGVRSSRLTSRMSNTGWPRSPSRPHLAPDTVSDTFIVTIDNVNDLPVVISALWDITPTEDDPNLAIDLGPVFHDDDPDDDAAMSYDGECKLK